jgi:hypothetical protein
MSHDLFKTEPFSPAGKDVCYSETKMKTYLLNFWNGTAAKLNEKMQFGNFRFSISSVSAASHSFDYLPGVYHNCLGRLGRNEEQRFNTVARISFA